MRRRTVGGVPAGLGRDFNLLWAGQTGSEVGDKITLVVVPAVVVFLLGGSAFDVGLISTAQYLAIPVLSLIAGALVDRWDLRRMLIACDLVRLTAIAAVPVAYALGVLSLPLLFACVLTMSVATVFFQIGYMPAIASIVRPAQLVPANARMETSRTVAELGGPAIGGALYQLAGVFALFLHAVTYLGSAVAIWTMRPFGQRTRTAAPVRRIFTRAWVGMRRNLGDPVLRKSTAGTLLANIGGPIFVTQMPVLAYQGLGLSAGAFGVVLSIAAGGALLGALLAPRASRLIGSGRVLALAMVCHSASGLGLLAVTRHPPVLVMAVTLASYGFFFSWYNINSAAIRQARVPVKDHAVIHGAYRTITWGVIPISTFVGGTVVSQLTPQLGVLSAARNTMLVATVIGIASIIPLATMHRLLATAPPMEPEPDDPSPGSTPRPGPPPAPVAAPVGGGPGAESAPGGGVGGGAGSVPGGGS
jgi:MFS family permease